MSRNWLADFKYEDGAWLVRKTGHRVPVTRSLPNEVFTWLTFYVLAQSWRTWRRLTGYRRPTIAFFPDKPRPWYFIWPTIHAAGARLVADPGKADIVFQFDDATTTDHAPPVTRPGARLVNFNCTDISKSFVAETFRRVSGYDLAVDPAIHNGPIVEKSEKNACHDGRIIAGPMQALPGKAYQMLVDNEIAGGLVEDLRCCICGGKPAVVFRKRRKVDRRFLNENDHILLDEPGNVYTGDEIDMITRFAGAIGLDWGGVDVLRDRHSRRI